MRKLIFALIASLLGGFANAQNTTVTATVVDSDSTTWINGTWSLSFSPNNNFPAPSQYTINGASLSTTIINQKGTLSSGGVLSVVTYDSTQVSPAGSGWNLTICPLASAKCSVYTFSTSGSTQNISSALTANIISPRFIATNGAYGYADVEAALQLNPGATYFNTTSSKQRIWNGAVWSDVGGGGGSGTVNAGTLGKPAYYAAAGTAVSGAPNNTYDANGNLVSTRQISASSLSAPVIAPAALYTYGDSLTAGTGITNLPSMYAARWATSLGLIGNAFGNRAISGDMSADVAWRIVSGDNPAITGTPNLYSILIGTNDANTNGVGPSTWEANYNLFLNADITWFGIPSGGKVNATTGTTTGTCTTDATFTFLTGEKCTAAASTITLSAVTTNGAPLYIWYRTISSDAGTWTYAIDGGSPVSVNTAPPINFTTINGHTSTMGVVRVTGVVAGSHSVVFTQTGSGTMSILAAGGLPTLALTSLPTVVVGGVPNQLDGNKLSTTQAYDADAKADATLLINDGLNVVIAPVSSVLQATTAAADMFNTLHPNDNGDLEIFRAFDQSIKQQIAAPIPLSYNPASNGILTGTNIQTVSIVGSGNGANYGFSFGNTSASNGYGRINLQGGSASQVTYGFFQSATGEWDWGMHGNLGKGTNLLLYDSVNSHYVIDLPQGMPQDSITGDVNGANLGGVHGVVTIYSAAGTPLPTCNTAAKGKDGVVSDATAPTYLGTYISGGAVIAPVFCNGTNWVTH